MLLSFVPFNRGTELWSISCSPCMYNILVSISIPLTLHARCSLPTNALSLNSVIDKLLDLFYLIVVESVMLRFPFRHNHC